MTDAFPWVGVEDISYIPIGGAIQTSQAVGIFTDTTAGRFRSGFARYGLNVFTQNNSYTHRLMSLPLVGGALSTFWTTARVWCWNRGNPNSSTNYPVTWWDSSGILRLRIKNVSTNVSGLQGPFTIEKITAAGVATTLGTFTAGTGFTNQPATPDKLDVFINDSATGRIQVFINQTLVCDTGTVDTTTDGVSSILQAGFSNVTSNSGGIPDFNSVWSEAGISPNDTRNLFGIVTLAATALGNTDTFTTGAVANINGNLANYSSPDNSQTAAQLQQYKTTPALPAGSFAIKSVISQIMATQGASGPQNLQSSKRIAGTDYASSNLSGIGSAWGTLVKDWDVSPATSNPWQASELPNNSTAFNTGYVSAT